MVVDNKVQIAVVLGLIFTAFFLMFGGGLFTVFTSGGTYFSTIHNGVIQQTGEDTYDVSFDFTLGRDFTNAPNNKCAASLQGSVQFLASDGTILATHQVYSESLPCGDYIRSGTIIEPQAKN